MIAQVNEQRRRNLGGFEVGRVLPFAKRRIIGLATLTYLFDGEIMHRDSVGSEQPIRPGEVNPGPASASPRSYGTGRVIGRSPPKAATSRSLPPTRASSSYAAT